MVILEQDSTLSAEGRLIVFPKFTMFLIEQGKRVRDKQDKLSNRHLSKMLMESVMNGKELPDVSVYDIQTKQWRDIKVPTSIKLTLEAGQYGSYSYTNILLDAALTKEQKVWIVQSYLLQYSSAKLTIN